MGVAPLPYWTVQGSISLGQDGVRMGQKLANIGPKDLPELCCAAQILDLCCRFGQSWTELGRIDRTVDRHLHEKMRTCIAAGTGALGQRWAQRRVKVDPGRIAGSVAVISRFHCYASVGKSWTDLGSIEQIEQTSAKKCANLNTVAVADLLSQDGLGCIRGELVLRSPKLPTVCQINKSDKNLS